MKIEKEVFETVLTPKAVDDCSLKIRNFLNKLKLDKKQITRYCLSAEEILVDMMGENLNKQVKLTMGKKLFAPYFLIQIDGVEKNVYIKKEDEHSFLGDSILSNLNLSPKYSYVNGRNEYDFHLKRKKLNPLITMLIALLAAVIVGSLGYLFSESLRETLTTNIINPIYETFLNILSCLAGPMIFLSVAWGIYGIGDVATLKKVGKSVFLGYSLTLFLCLVIVALISIPLFNLNFSSEMTGGNTFYAIFQMFLDIFPKNIIAPFYDGNTLQIIFLAFIIGIALIFLGKKTTSVARAIEQINYIIQFITEFISKLVPFFTFIVLTKMIWTSTVYTFLDMWKLFVVLIGATLFISVLLVSYVAIKQRVNFFSLIKKGLPTLLSAITTASSAAAFGINLKTSTEEYGINKSLVAFSIPLGMVLCKTATSISYMILAYFFAEYFGISVTVDWFVLVVIISGVLAMATPPIPGGAAIAYTILFTQFLSSAGAEVISLALSLTVTVDVFLDFITTGFDQFLLPFALINNAGRVDLLDKEVLRSKKQALKK